MLGMNSEVQFGGILQDENFSVVSESFEVSSRSYIFTYKGSRRIESGEEVVIYVTNFKNPVNMRRKSGFKLTTLDS